MALVYPGLNRQILIIQVVVWISIIQVQVLHYRVVPVKSIRLTPVY